jgi:uncharacterized protein
MRAVRVDIPTARRFVLGVQGLWPGRRWKGVEGLQAALEEIGSVQVDPLDVVGHSQDLVLSSRVIGYRPRQLERALYQTRTLFEWGGNLQIRPVDELPYLLPRIRVADYLGRRARWERSHRAVVRRVLREVEERGPLGSRDLRDSAGVSSYRARKEAGLALYYLWWRGELMIHSRRRGERQYDLTRRLVPRRLLRPAPAPIAERHLFRRAMRAFGLPNASELLAVQRGSGSRPISARRLRAWIDARERQGRLVRVEVEGWHAPHWVDAEAAPTLERLRAGEVPKAWRPLSTTTEEEATFLAPLETVSARGRAKHLFDFDYLWEVYKPASKRRWGYYTLPILHGERLRARADLRYDRPSGCVRVLGFWLEDATSATDRRFAHAVGRGLERLRRMTGAATVDLGRIRPSGFRAAVAQGR